VDSNFRFRAKKWSRSNPSLKTLPGCVVVVGDTAEEGREKRASLDSLVHPDSGAASLSIALGWDASQFDLGGPLPEIPETNASKSGRERGHRARAARESDCPPIGADRRQLWRPFDGRHPSR
jgi:alkanesulfonate monooxygenase SsuD/methylene tetrahydromethanopterin reductase-like flavin-dependent oxidoreductase (luciferase family)